MKNFIDIFCVVTAVSVLAVILILGTPKAEAGNLATDLGVAFTHAR